MSAGRVLLAVPLSAAVLTSLGCEKAGPSVAPTEAATVESPPKASPVRASAADYERAVRFGSDAFGELATHSTIYAHWIGESSRFWFRDATVEGHSFFALDASTGERKAAFDHQAVADGLQDAFDAWSKNHPEERAELEKLKAIDARDLPFERVAFDDEEKRLSFSYAEQRWECAFADYRCALKESPPRVQSAEGERDTILSEDKKWVALTYKNDVYLKKPGGRRGVRLTRDGSEGNAYEAVSWSKDGRWLVLYRVKEGERAKMHLVESSPKKGLRPKLHSYGYALPGDKLDQLEMWVVDTRTKKKRKVELPPIAWGWPYPKWEDGDQRFRFRMTDRGYLRERVVEVDATTAKARTLVDEQSDTRIDPHKRVLNFVKKSDEIIWASERDGHNHLYLYDAKTGQLKNQITKGPWVVRGLVGVDEEQRVVYFLAGGREQGRNPYYRHLYRVNFDGSGLSLLTPEDADHDVSMSHDHRWVFDRFSRVDLAPTMVVRDSSEGKVAHEVARVEITALEAEDWPAPEPFHAKGRDGKTDIYGVIYRPSTLDPKRKYPVVELIYSGPQWAYASKAFHAQRSTQALAELGFIVVQIDGMGTNHRSKAFHDHSWKNLGDAGLPDHIAWIKAAADRYPYVDTSRVGIYGHSAGGYDSTRALLAHGDFYKAAVSMSGNHDHRTDKVWWNELWMGYPVGEHYERQSNVTNAAKLEGKLLLIHGEMDRNVNPHASTMQLVNALVQANKDFELLILPGRGHNVGGPYTTRRIWDFFVRNLQGGTPPVNFEIPEEAD